MQQIQNTVLGTRRENYCKIIKLSWTTRQVPEIFILQSEHFNDQDKCVVCNGMRIYSSTL